MIDDKSIWCKQFSKNYFNAAQASYKEYSIPKPAPIKVKTAEVWNFPSIQWPSKVNNMIAMPIFQAFDNRE